jgi:hypothetical protein
LSRTKDHHSTKLFIDNNGFMLIRHVSGVFHYNHGALFEYEADFTSNCVKFKQKLQISCEVMLQSNTYYKFHFKFC